MSDPVGADEAEQTDRLTREPIDLLLRDLGTTPDGLGSREAQRRLHVQGPNVLPQPRRSGWMGEVVRQLGHPLALLLWLASALALVAGTPALTVAILAVLAINALVAFVQEQQATRAVEALAAYLPAQARVVRDGTTVTVAARELVRGDVVLVSEGDRVSADARLITGSVQLDLSALTGESVPVERTAGAHDVATRLTAAPDTVFSGTACTGGHGRAVVFATGTHTEIGRIAALSQRGKRRESPLERQVRRSAWLIAGVAVLIGALFVPLGLLAGLSLEDAAVFAVGLLVANVPEGLLPTITLALALGVRALAREGALVKRLSAVETLGSTTVICTDKTGTLTQNRMAVTSVWGDGRSWTFPENAEHSATVPPWVSTIADVMGSCFDLEATADPMEDALREAARCMGGVARQPLQVFRFDARRRRMSVVTRHARGLQVYVKGAPEAVLPLCISIAGTAERRTMTDADRAEVVRVVDALARDGLRVLALATREAHVRPQKAEQAECDLTLAGLVALADPPRPEVAPAVAACHRAGIRVHVITGDHARTAEAVARAVGIEPVRVLDGEQSAALSEPALDALLASPGELVFARSAPEDKLRIAEALDALGETVAMTGDGVNDAPALHRADIGVAMGRSGTDVAREAATMILTDDDFATIVTAVREGRRVYDNLRKFVLYIFAHAVPEVVPFAIFALSAGRVPLPLTVLQILAIDLGTETLPALALGRERAEPDTMSRPPRPPGEHLITGRTLVRAWAVMGSISAVLAVTLYFAFLLRAGWHAGADVGAGSPLHEAYRQATTVTFAAIVACQVGTAMAARCERSALREIGLLSNPLLLAGIGFELAFAAAVIYLPVANRIFGTAALPAWVIAALLPCPLIVWSADELFRAAGRHRLWRTAAPA